MQIAGAAVSVSGIVREVQEESLFSEAGGGIGGRQKKDELLNGADVNSCIGDRLGKQAGVQVLGFRLMEYVKKSGIGVCNIIKIGYTS